MTRTGVRSSHWTFSTAPPTAGHADFRRIGKALSGMLGRTFRGMCARSFGGSETVMLARRERWRMSEKGVPVIPWVGYPDSLHAEVDVRTPDEPAVLGQLARSWLQAGLESLATDQ